MVTEETAERLQRSYVRFTSAGRVLATARGKALQQAAEEYGLARLEHQDAIEAAQVELYPAPGPGAGDTESGG